MLCFSPKRVKQQTSQQTAAILIVAVCLLLPLKVDALFFPKWSDEAVAHLPEKYQEWVKIVDLLLSEEERTYFLGLERDFRRDAFIAAFWQKRDPYDDTHTNELQRDWTDRVDVARVEFEDLLDARSRVLLLKGEPLVRCRDRTREREDWYYQIGERTVFKVTFIRYAWSAPYFLWTPSLVMRPTLRQRILQLTLAETCEMNADLLSFATSQSYGGQQNYEAALEKFLEPPSVPSKEWVATFASYSTDLPAGAETFDAELEVDFLGRHQSRTVMQGLIALPRDDVAVIAEDDRERLFLLTGEVVRDEQLLETFRVRFAAPRDRLVPLIFQRYLRPGSATLLLKLEDLYTRRMARWEQELEIPSLEKTADTPQPVDSELVQLLTEANEAAALGERIIRLLPPPGIVHTGLVRFKTFTAGDFAKVQFFLNDQPLLTKKTPPYSVELDLGPMPTIASLRVSALDEQGIEVADDEILLNPGGQRFRTRLLEPRSGIMYRHSVRAVAEVLTPDGEDVERLELFLNEDRVATLYQPPFTQPIILPEAKATAYVRAVAYLADGNTSEDLVFINAPDFGETLDVQLVELHASVHDSDGRPVLGLGADDFAVFEDEVPQTLRRFEWVKNLPIHAALLLDTSASMEEIIDQVGDAAQSFVAQTIEPKDRVALLTFNSLPHVEQRFTNDVAAVAASLETLKAEGGTALYDSLVFALHYFHGVRGQKALLLLSDGEDESSRFHFEGALEYAHRAGVMIYTIGLEEASRSRQSRRVLRQIAEETGGRSFFVEDLSELRAIYHSIQQELRSQYLLAYQSTSTRDPAEFRRIAVRLSRKGLEVRTMSGYFP